MWSMPRDLIIKGQIMETIVLAFIDRIDLQYILNMSATLYVSDMMESFSSVQILNNYTRIYWIEKVLLSDKSVCFQHCRYSDRWNIFLIEFLCNFTTRILQITYFILGCLSLRFLKYLLRHIFLWFMAFLYLEFMYGTCAFTILVFMGVCLSNLDMNDLSCIP